VACIARDYRTPAGATALSVLPLLHVTGLRTNILFARSTGLGLWVVKDLLEKFRGTIEMESSLILFTSSVIISDPPLKPESEVCRFVTCLNPHTSFEI
jgi:hypothetical protein